MKLYNSTTLTRHRDFVDSKYNLQDNICDECNSSVKYLLTETTRRYSNGVIETRHICKDCEYDLFDNNNSPHSIFE